MPKPILASEGPLDSEVNLIEKPFSASAIIEKAGRILNGHFEVFRTLQSPRRSVAVASVGYGFGGLFVPNSGAIRAAGFRPPPHRGGGIVFPCTSTLTRAMFSMNPG
jgi:hypothetical protein